MKRLIALSCLLVLLLASFACDKSKHVTEPQTLQKLERLPLKIAFSGAGYVIIDGVKYEAKAETTIVLPEKYWPENRWYTFDELVKRGIKTEGLHKTTDGPDWYFVLHSGSIIQIPKSCEGNIFFYTLGTTFPSNNCFTDALIDPHTYVEAFYSGALQYSDIYDVDSGGNTDCGGVDITSPGSLLQNYYWNIGSSGYDGGWTNNDGEISGLSVFYDTCNLAGGHINISQIVFHLTAI